jgi:ribosomal protein L11 methyltransferase
MKSKVLWQVSARVARVEAEEAVCELLSSRFGQPTSVYSNLETGTTTVALYLGRKPSWTRAARLDLTKGLSQVQGVRWTKALEPKLSKIQPRNWAEAWKRHFKPLLIGKRLLIRPSWSRRRPGAGQLEVVLDPGMSFGTGQHPTTSFCLEGLVRARVAAKRQALLDVGTGSGILAIAAAKLEYRPVHALDIDPEAAGIARLNARTNGVGAAIRTVCKDLSAVSGPKERQYEVVCANLLANVLILEAPRLKSLIRPGGVLIAAGILDEEFHQVQKVYEAAGLRLVRSRRQKEWRSGVFLRKFLD